MFSLVKKLVDLVNKNPHAGDKVELIKNATDDNKDDTPVGAYIRGIQAVLARFPKNIITIASKIGSNGTGINEMLNSSRFLAYASEAGEASRPIIPKFLVNSLYVLSGGYVLGCVGLATHDAYYNNRKKKLTNQQHATVVFADQFVWHSIASMIMPAVVVHTIVKYSTEILKLYGSVTIPFVSRFAPTVFALSCIPFIIEPIDKGTDFVANNVWRPFYKDLVSIPYHH